MREYISLSSLFWSCTYCSCLTTIIHTTTRYSTRNISVYLYRNWYIFLKYSNKISIWINGKGIIRTGWLEVIILIPTWKYKSRSCDSWNSTNITTKISSISSSCSRPSRFFFGWYCIRRNIIMSNKHLTVIMFTYCKCNWRTCWNYLSFYSPIQESTTRIRNFINCTSISDCIISSSTSRTTIRRVSCSGYHNIFIQVVSIFLENNLSYTIIPSQVKPSISNSTIIEIGRPFDIEIILYRHWEVYLIFCCIIE